jgi:UDP-3-O-[3-hydroxymyristoyl] glucosamine N-acyltransferase
LKLSELAVRLDCRLEGDGSLEIVRVAGIQRAEPGDLTFLTNARYLTELATTRASGGHRRVEDAGDRTSAALLRSDDPYSAFARAVGVFAHAVPPPNGVDRLSAVAPDATLGADVSIGPFVAIGAGASIGARTVIYPNAVIGPGARIGEDCILHRTSPSASASRSAIA